MNLLSFVEPAPSPASSSANMSAVAKAPIAKGTFVGQTTQFRPRALAQAPLRAALTVRAEAEQV